MCHAVPEHWHAVIGLAKLVAPVAGVGLDRQIDDNFLNI